MKVRNAALIVLVLTATGPSALALNKIVEWGGHDPNDYVIDFIQGYGDKGVRILRNTQPELVWKFEAFDDPTQAPGDIDYIKIADGVTVEGIHLSVIGNPNDLPAPLYGAAQLKLLDLQTHGGQTNSVDMILISGDFGALGAMRAYDVGTVSIGGSVVNTITVSDVGGPLTIGGTLGPVLADRLTGTFGAVDIVNDV
jgi:hypothetical protein